MVAPGAPDAQALAHCDVDKASAVVGVSAEALHDCRADVGLQADKVRLGRSQHTAAS